MTAHTQKMIANRPWIEYRCKACGKPTTQRQGMKAVHIGCPKGKHSKTQIVVPPKFVPVN